jgi:hypothetical protein
MLTTKPVTKSQMIEQNWKTYEQHVRFFDTNAIGIEFKKLYPTFCKFTSRGDLPNLDEISDSLKEITLTPKFMVCKKLALNINSLFLMLYLGDYNRLELEELVGDILDIKIGLRAYEIHSTKLNRNFAMARGKCPY